MKVAREQQTAKLQRWNRRLLIWGPYVLMALGGGLTLASLDLINDSPGERQALAVLTAVTLAWQVLGGRLVKFAEQPQGQCSGEASSFPAAGRVYFAVRTALAAALTWLNPFFAIYAAMGYFDAVDLLPPRWARVGMVLTALSVAGSQSGGLPPSGAPGWLAFILLFVLNSGLVVFFEHLGRRQEEVSQGRQEAIGELERTNAQLEQALADNAALHEQLLVQAREAGVSEERGRLAAEIHDTLAQGLTGIITQLQAARESTDRPGELVHLDRAGALARESLREARRSVRDLAPAALAAQALPDALCEVAGSWSETSGVPSEVVCTGTPEPLNAELEATLLRICQEALANVAKHAAAGRVAVTLSFMGDEVVLDVRDDGRGFDPHSLGSRPPAVPAGPPAGGFGLGGMRARAERMAGELEIESEPGGGTAVSARVPLVGRE